MLTTKCGATFGDTGAIQRIYRRKQLPEVTGLGVDQIDKLIRAGRFPQPIPLGPRALGFLESEIADWQRERIEARDSEKTAP